jgi:hypothetical protein
MYSCDSLLVRYVYSLFLSEKYGAGPRVKSITSLSISWRANNLANGYTLPKHHSALQTSCSYNKCFSTSITFALI